jgi:parallel beta-helix repeat protein
MSITSNTISQSAIAVSPNGQKSLPVPTIAAIQSGTQATVSGNWITQTASVGIYLGRGSQVSSNFIRESCMMLSDCGAIYMYGADNNATVSRNLILNLEGTTNGTPLNIHTVGIYLDEPSSGNTITGNTVAFAEYGIQLHNAYNNLVENNTLFGNRIYQLWLQENTNRVNGKGDVFGNRIYANRIIPTGVSNAVSQQTSYATTANFATYDLNLYSTLTNSYVSREKWANGDMFYTFKQWQTAAASTAVRNLDASGRQIATVGYTSFEVAGDDLTKSEDFSTQPLQWESWNEHQPKAQLHVESDGTRNWLKLVAGGSSSLVSSPNFSVSEGQWYRLTFDMKTGKNDQKVVIVPRRGGGGANGYELITDGELNVYGSTSWNRYSLMFKASKTVRYRDPITHDYGARIDFQQIQPGDYVQLAKVELIPMRSVGTVVQTALLSNSSNAPTAVGCPDLEVAPEVCGYYVRFTDGQAIAWPYELPAFGSEVIYTRDDSLVDTDSDGIADKQDKCAETAAGDAANSNGCALGQNPA